ncbi:DUF3857 domain-containing protein [Salegentibacter flavus]|uniref:Uncharacterized protein n=1 Tax=Salegentibacter flavus TaxID=287099 RepID=A0A1I4Y3M1_9FLAO|nr:DUF3857 domain-containing protein [Salegentibacter flavus]SFN32672.1 protein of unknown function [Salegentibacter flavus]
MNKLLLLLFFLPSLTSISQEKNFNLMAYRPSLEELEATSYEKDTTANAWYIAENGYSRYENDGNYNVITDYAAKIKILNQEAYDQASISIRLYKNKSAKEKIRKIEAITYTLEEGRVKTTEITADDIYTEENPDFDLIKFTFPNVTPGSVLTYRYQKESPFRYSFETWWFQDEIPKVSSTFETRIPGNFNYNIRTIGGLPYNKEDVSIIKNCFHPDGISESGDCVHAFYEIRDIPAFIEESYLTSKYNYIARLVYELKEVTQLNGRVKKFTLSWKDVDKQLKSKKSIGRQLSRTRLVKDLLPDSLRQLPNNTEKARGIYDFVKNNYKWNGKYQLHRDFNLKDVIRDKSGNISGINILLHNLYESEGFEVLPVLSATRANGFLTKLHPVINDFNYLFLQLKTDDQEFLVDATEKYLNFGEIPFRALNGYGRLVDFKNGSSWINIEARHFSGIHYRDSLMVDAAGIVTGHSQQIYSGLHAVSARKELENLQISEIAGRLSNPAQQTGVVTSSFKNHQQVSNPLQIQHELSTTSQKIDEVIYLNPFSFRFFSKNPLQLEERTYPIDFGYKDVYTYSVNVELPENYSPIELPEQKLITLPENGGRIQLVAQQTDEKNIFIHYRISFNRALYVSGFYPYLKKFFNDIIEIQNQSLIAIKENT